MKTNLYFMEVFDMKKELKITACGIFLKEIMVIKTEYSEEGMNLDGSLRAIENVRQAVTFKPIILWNPKKYNKEVMAKAQS